MTVIQGNIRQPHINKPGRGAEFGSVPLHERFWAKVEKTETCWKWIGSTSRGRGTINIDGRPRFSSRVSWEIHNGPIPRGQRVLHECDNPICVRPDHLFLGTQTDNLEDMRRKGRGALPPVMRGDRSPSAKLNARQVGEIKARGAETLSALAAEFGVSVSTVWAIRAGRNWKAA